MDFDTLARGQVALARTPSLCDPSHIIELIWRNNSTWQSNPYKEFGWLALGICSKTDYPSAKISEGNPSRVKLFNQRSQLVQFVLFLGNHELLDSIHITFTTQICSSQAP
jgi:hypothetical protein